MQISTKVPVGRVAFPPEPSPVLDAARLFALLRRRAGSIALVLVLSLLCGVVGLIMATPKYTATAVLIVDPRQQRITSAESVLPGIGNDAFAVESQVEVVQSTALARKVIDSLGLDRDPEFASRSIFSDAWERTRAALGMGASEPDLQQRVLSRFSQQLQVKRRGLTYVIEVGFTSKDADKAARIANAVAQGYLDGQVDMKLQATSQASGRLNDRLTELRQQADAAERAVADYKATHSLVDTGERRGIVEQQLADLNTQLVQARVHESEVQARYDQMRRVSAEGVAANGLPEALASPVILALRTQYAQAARSQADLAEIYGPRHPSLKSGAAQLDALKRQVASEIGRLSAGLRNELEAARGRVRGLETSLATLKKQSADVDQATVRLRELERDAEATRTVLQQSLLRFKETTEQQSFQVSDARILSPASPPLQPSSPVAALVLALAGVGGLVLGVGIVLARELTTRSFRSSREAELALSLPVLGLLPEVPSADLARTASRPGRGASARTRDAGLARYAADQPLSAYGEAIRGLAIRLRSAQGSGSQVLLVTSALGREGTSSVAGNLAHALAAGGASTVLVQAALRRADPEAPEGLFEILRDGEPPTALLADDPSGRFKVLPPGRVDDPAKASELLAGSAMDITVHHLKQKFDVVVLEGPPLLSRADGRALLDLADGAVLVVAWGRTERESVAAALDATGVNAGKFQGLVFNKVEARAESRRASGISHAWAG